MARMGSGSGRQNRQGQLRVSAHTNYINPLTHYFSPLATVSSGHGGVLFRSGFRKVFTYDLEQLIAIMESNDMDIDMDSDLGPIDAVEALQPVSDVYMRGN